MLGSSGTEASAFDLSFEEGACAGLSLGVPLLPVWLCGVVAVGADPPLPDCADASVEPQHSIAANTAARMKSARIGIASFVLQSGDALKLSNAPVREDAPSTPEVLRAWNGKRRIVLPACTPDGRQSNLSGACYALLHRTATIACEVSSYH